MISRLEITFSMNSFSLWVWNFKFPCFSIFSSHTILLLGNTGPRFMTFLALLYFLPFFFFFSRWRVQCQQNKWEFFNNYQWYFFYSSWYLFAKGLSLKYITFCQKIWRKFPLKAAKLKLIPILAVSNPTFVFMRHPKAVHTTAAAAAGLAWTRKFYWQKFCWHVLLT